MKKDKRYYEQEKKLKSSIFFIEANFFEHLALWKEFKEENKWEQEHIGFSECIGYISGHKSKPVNVCFLFAQINNKRICFYDVISRYSDSQMIERYINKYSKNITNAMNFHLAIQACLDYKTI